MIRKPLCLMAAFLLIGTFEAVVPLRAADKWNESVADAVKKDLTVKTPTPTKAKAAKKTVPTRKTKLKKIRVERRDHPKPTTTPFGESFTADQLDLQSSAEQESRKAQALSKASEKRHDATKNAVGNVR